VTPTPSPPPAGEVLRVANCSGFYGDRHAAAREMVEGGPIDVLTGDYLAELTMTVLWKNRQRAGGVGWCRGFLRQLEEVLGTCAERGIRIVTNAGGLDPAGLAEAVRELAERVGVAVRVAHVEGDDLVGRLDELQAAGRDLAHLETGARLDVGRTVPVTANAYLGAWGIVEALRAGADVVVCGRVTDASLVVGPAAWHFGWARDDWDRLAGAVVAGHVLECGAQATGGNYAFFREVPGLRRPGFPLAEVRPDGSFVVTKHAGTGGAVSVGTVTAQLLYEIEGPAYANPDVVARFDTIELVEEGPDRVEVRGVQGEPPPATTKVVLNCLAGYRNRVTFRLTGLDVEAKAALAEETLLELLGGAGAFDEVTSRLARTDQAGAATSEQATASLQVTLTDRDAEKVGRRVGAAAVEMALASYPGLFLDAPPTEAAPRVVCWPTLVPAADVTEAVVDEDGKRHPVPQVAVPPEVRRAAAARAGSVSTRRPAGEPAPVEEPQVASLVAAELQSPTRRVPLGALFGARSGDKAGNANVGVWARDDLAWAWLAANLTVNLFRELVPEAAGLRVRRYELPNLRALNFVVVGLLGEGALSSVRQDAQAKGLGEFLRSRPVDLPVALLGG
jgi:hypothetical protein